MTTRLDHPVRLRAIEDLSRSRLTVFFRFFLAIPHLIWLGLWTVGTIVVAFIAWFVVLAKGQMPAGLHRFFTMYLRYATHVNAYLNLAANPFPGFLGENGYEIDLDIDPPARQNRWTVGFRFILALPALMLAATLGGGASGSFTTGASTYGLQATGVVTFCAVLVWFYALVKGSAPEGISRLQWYCLHYGAQAGAYALLVTDRYPTADPERVGVPWPAPEHPVTLTAEPDDGSRSRLTVFFRLPLAIPHVIWLELWSLLALVLAFVNWVVTLIRGRSPEVFHRFFTRFIRYQAHVSSFITIVANPFPGFAGAPASYPVDVQVGEPTRQNRWTVLFRGLLAFPAFLLASAIGAALGLVALFGWFASLVTGRMPDGLRKLGLFSLRYSAQTYAYAFGLLTSRYPYAGPPA